MTRTKQVLLAGAVLPAFALCMPIPAGAGDGGTMILAQQQDQQQQQKKQQQQQQKPGQPPQQKPAAPPSQAPPPRPPAAQQPHPPPPPPAAQQPHPPAAPPPHPPAAQPPVRQPPPAAQQPHPPAAPPPAAQQPHPAAPPPPAAQQPHPPAAPPPPAAQQPHPAAPPPPAAQQPHPAAPPPPAAQQPHPAAPPPPAAQQPPPAVPPPPAAQQPHPAAPPPPAAQQPHPAAPPPPAAQQPGRQPPPAAQGQPTPPAAFAAPGVGAAPRTSQEVQEQRQRAEQWRSGKVQDLRAQRQEVHEGGRTFIREPDRTIVEQGGHVIIRHNEVDRFAWHARDVRVEQEGRNTVTIVERPDGIRIVTYTDPDGHLYRRLRRYPDGREVIIIDSPEREYRDIGDYYVDLPPPVIRIPRERYILDAERATEADIYGVFTEPPVEPIERAYSLDEIRYSRPLLERMPSVDVDTINFDFGAWEVTPDQVERLAAVAQAINQTVAANPQEVFLIEGHTDAVGSDVDNLSLSDRRAQAVAQVLTERFQVPPENLTTQGYGKQYLKIPTDAPERRNRRVTVRRITPLLAGRQ
ncbi:MAG TPA: OmpA family protein [Xanthobacteraceae bacterium]|nr:OmpA family protein [Xanthobacteraceae bacterium]